MTTLADALKAAPTTFEVALTSVALTVTMRGPETAIAQMDAYAYLADHPVPHVRLVAATTYYGTPTELLRALHRAVLEAAKEKGVEL